MFSKRNLRSDFPTRNFLCSRLLTEEDAVHRSQKLAFSVAEAAVHADLCRDYVYTAIRDGSLRARKAGRRTLILRADLEAFLEELPGLNLRRPKVSTE
jgi:excisionase family DNA binding protein